MQATVTILGIPVAAPTMAEAVAKLEQFIDEGTPHIIATANAEMIMMAQTDTELARVLREADLVVPDGAGVVWAARYQGHPIPERVAGYDLTQELLARASQKGYRVYFLGAAPGIAEAASRAACNRYPGLIIAGVQDGYFQPEDDGSVISAICQAKPHILLAALGVPKQEKWLHNNQNRLGVAVAMGVGGTFDVMAGVVERAPVWMQRSSLEWLFRLYKQPYRAIRMLALPRFVIKVWQEKNN